MPRQRAGCRVQGCVCRRLPRQYSTAVPSQTSSGSQASSQGVSHWTSSASIAGTGCPSGRCLPDTTQAPHQPSLLIRRRRVRRQANHRPNNATSNGIKAILIIFRR